MAAAPFAFPHVGAGSPPSFSFHHRRPIVRCEGDDRPPDSKIKDIRPTRWDKGDCELNHKHGNIWLEGQETTSAPKHGKGVDEMTMATKPKLAAITARGEWTGDVRTEVRVRHFAPILMDEPRELGGTDLGANPMEYVLAALMGCETVLMAMVAQERNFTYDGIEYDLRGTLDLRGLEGATDVRPYFREITGTVRVTTTETEADLLDVAKEVERRCPVYTMLAAADVKFNVDWQAVRP